MSERRGRHFRKLYAFARFFRRDVIMAMNIGSAQEGEVNTSNLADPMIMAIITSRRKKCANAYNFRKWRPRLSHTTFCGGFLQSSQLEMVLYLDLKE